MKKNQKLTKFEADQIRAYKASGWANKEIAWIFKVSQAHVSRVLRNYRWPDDNYDKCRSCKWNKRENKRVEIPGDED